MTITELQQRTDERFDFILEDDEGQIIFAAPMPLEYAKTYGLSYAITEKGFCIGTEDFGVFEDAWDKYATELMAKARAVPGSEPRTQTGDARAASGKERRTKALAGKTSEPIDRVAIITDSRLRRALAPMKDDNAYVLPISPELAESLVFENGVLKEDDFRLTFDNYDPGLLSELNFFMLKIIYSVILREIETAVQKERTADRIMSVLEDPNNEYVVSMYVPDFMRMIGDKPNADESRVRAAIDKLRMFDRLVGIHTTRRSERTCQKKYAVMLYHGWSQETNTIRFSSPYLNHIAKHILNDNLRKDGKGNLQLSNSGQAKTMPCHSYALQTSLSQERNKGAVEIVCYLVYLVETTGSGKESMPKAKAVTILNECPVLKHRIECSKTSSDRNKIIRAAFVGARKILENEKYAGLRKKFTNREMECPIPTWKTRDKTVWRFPYKDEGRKRD